MTSLAKVNRTGPFKDILAHVPLDDSAEGVIRSAVSMARLFTAHIDGVVAIEKADSQERPSGIGPVALQMVADFESTMRTAAYVLRKFETAAERAALSYGKRVIADKADLIDRTLLKISRLYDLSIVVQPRLSPNAVSGSTPRAMLFDSGRPVILIPLEHRGGIDLDRIAICWDGGRYAARAVHDAMPLLENARSIDIIAVNEDDNLDTSSEALAIHLTRRQLGSTVRRLSSDLVGIHKTILSTVADTGSSLVVMGGYGHSKAGRFVLGGVTRDAFENMTVPTFISF
jgi:nucleotide-binding universal stress UspA family protein